MRRLVAVAAVTVVLAACVETSSPETGPSPTSTVGVSSTLGSGSSTTVVSEPINGDTAVAILDIAQAGRGFFTEGSFSFIEVTESNGDLIEERFFGPGEHIVMQLAVAAGQIGIRAYQRGCSGFCPPGGDMDALDYIAIECETTIEVSEGELVRVLVDGRDCEITRKVIPEATPRRCLPDEVAMRSEPKPPSDGLVSISVVIENTGQELCEVVLDDVRANLTYGAGHLVPDTFVVGNPLFFSAGSGAIFPGEALRLGFEWRNTCGEPVVTFQVDVENIGLSHTEVPYPCNIGEKGTFEFIRTAIIGEKARGMCSGAHFDLVVFPHPSALDALSDALDNLTPSFENPRMAALSEMSTNDFVPALRVGTEITFRSSNEVQEATLRARHAQGGWGIDWITVCDYS